MQVLNEKKQLITYPPPVTLKFLEKYQLKITEFTEIKII